MFNREGNKKYNLYIMVAIIVCVSLLFRLISDGLTWWGSGSVYDFAQMSLMFIGVPALITLLVIKYAKTPKTAYGISFRTITLFLLMSSILLGEGTLCIILASPIFYGVGSLIVYAREKSKKNGNMYSVGVFVLLIFALEIPEINKEHEIHSVVVSKTFDHDLSFNELNKSPDFMNDLPDLFKIGFPKPGKIKGQGIEIGSLREIEMTSATKGTGTLVLEISAISNDSLVFNPKSDDTHINHWLTWKKVKIELDKSEKNRTKVTWTSEYVCDLGPAWYFEPIERYAVGVMNKHLLNSYFVHE